MREKGVRLLRDFWQRWAEHLGQRAEPPGRGWWKTCDSSTPGLQLCFIRSPHSILNYFLKISCQYLKTSLLNLRLPASLLKSLRLCLRSIYILPGHLLVGAEQPPLVLGGTYVLLFAPGSGVMSAGSTRLQFSQLVPLAQPLAQCMTCPHAPRLPAPIGTSS